jgi:hypothetical protein
VSDASTRNVAGWYVATALESSNLQAQVKQVYVRCSTSIPVKVHLQGTHVNTVTAYIAGGMGFFSGTAITCLNNQGKREKGVFVFAYSGKQVTAGAKHGLVIFAINPPRYVIVSLNNTADCRSVSPLEKCSVPFWRGVQKCPVLSWLALHHVARVETKLTGHSDGVASSEIQTNGNRSCLG